MVTAEQVWAALGEIPAPEIPVISLVDLGVIRDVAVDGEHVRIEFTPTFLGCPALEFMKRAMEEKVPGAEVIVVQDDSWSTDRITPAARAARGNRAEACPASGKRLLLSLLRLDRDAPREPLRPDAVPLAALLR